ncbi:MAG TPA: AAA family ATPase [Blastocatellia bacterium]|nr:AAA family ATPase [Blastocatellia bacterium]
MKITIPIYIEAQSASTTVYSARPLFFPAPVEKGEVLNRVMTRLARSLRRELDLLGRELRHDRLAAYSFCPEVDDRILTLTLDLRQRRAACRFLFVAFEALERRLAFTPSLPDLWFEVGRGEALAARAAEVLTRHFRDLEKRDGKDAQKPEDLSVNGKAWVTTLDINIQPPRVASQPERSLFAALGGQETLSGAYELEKVGRRLDWLYPDELDRVVCRDEEAAELTKLLSAPDRRPVLLLGPRLAGKTALVHEYVYRAVAKRRSAHASRKNVWLISPQRLISGMSYVGQWENRLLAILKEATKQGHILYFDDLLGLFHAGISRDSDLSVAHVLKPYVEKRQFRMLAEITPEAFRVFQERDRAFADLFQILPVKQTGEDETLRIVIELMRQLERQHRCRFDLEALPAALDLQRRYVRDAAFPGKAALFLRQLAVKYRNAEITRATVFAEFHAKSGLRVSFLDNRVELARKEVIEALAKEVIGQPAALEAAADVVCVAKARLNDPDRPLASFLFLGPTGVGKTQCAKSLAAYLFGDADRILRFDMNEFLSASSVARLVGTFRQPEGLLTSAIRRQPFSVVLLDEIEKAHPDVFNLLLQVMGEGRLTDALGRAADFTNAILILTSNLGVKEASSNLGFKQGETREGSVYRQAAEKFFKPEFFNRLDRIVPFERLRREDVRDIARNLIQGVFHREGLLRRRCVLQVDERAMEKIVDQGYHPTLGARALKRAIERQLTQPVAARLAAIKVETPTIISLLPGDEGIHVRVQALTQAEPDGSTVAALDLSDAGRVLRRVEAALARIEGAVSHLQPDGAIAADAVQPEHYRYFLIKEHAQRIRAMAVRIEEDLNRRERAAGKTYRPRPRHLVVRWDRWTEGPQRVRSLRQLEGPPERPDGAAVADRQSGYLLMRPGEGQEDARLLLNGIVGASDMRRRLRQLAAAATPHGREFEDYLADLLRETALLQTILGVNEQSPAGQALICIRALAESAQRQRAALRDLYGELFGKHLGLEATMMKGRLDAEGQAGEFILLRGPHALTLAKVEEGTHLFYPAHGNIVPLQVTALPLADGEDPMAAIAVHAGRDIVFEEPADLLPVIRIYEEQGVTLDLRTGLMTLDMPPAGDLRTFVLSTLQAPQEFLWFSRYNNHDGG